MELKAGIDIENKKIVAFQSHLYGIESQGVSDGFWQGFVSIAPLWN